MKKGLLKALCFAEILAFTLPAGCYYDKERTDVPNYNDEQPSNTENLEIKKINKLIENNEDVNALDDYGKSQIIKLLEKLGADVIDGEYKCTPLCYVCSIGDIELAKILIEKGADVNIRDNYGETPLILSLLLKQTEAAKLLIEEGADVNKFDQYGNCPLSLAIEYNQTELEKLLIEKGADIDTCDDFGTTALVCAIRNGNVELAKQLIEKGADINTEHHSELDFTQSSIKPINAACYYGNNEIVKVLIENNVDINGKDSYEHTPLYYAVENEQIETVKLLIEKGANVNTPCWYNNNTLLHFAAAHGDYELAKILIEKGANINITNDRGETPLYTAIEEFHIKEYIKYKENIGDLALLPYYPYKDGHVEIIRLLKDNGAKANEEELIQKCTNMFKTYILKK